MDFKLLPCAFRAANRAVVNHAKLLLQSVEILMKQHRFSDSIGFRPDQVFGI